MAKAATVSMVVKPIRDFEGAMDSAREAALAAWNTFKTFEQIRRAHHDRAKRALAERLGLPTEAWHFLDLNDWLYEAGGEELVDLAIAPLGLPQDLDDLGRMLALLAGEYEPVVIDDVDVPMVMKWTSDRCHEALQAKQTWLRTLVDIPPLAAHMNDVADVLAILVVSALAALPTRGRICVTVSQEGGHHRFEVADSGPDLAPEEIRSFFKSFDDLRLWEQGGNLRGSGFDFVLARLLIEFYGGSMGVTSNPGQGSVIWFTVRSSEASRRTP